MTNTKADLVRGWLEKARRDLLTAERGLDSAEPFMDIVCFHAQQATEKHLKSYLLWHEIEFPRTHALEDLVLLAAEKDAGFALHKDDVTKLTPYAVEARYPEFEEPRLVFNSTSPTNLNELNEPNEPNEPYTTSYRP